MARPRAAPAGTAVSCLDGHQLTLTHLDKVLYPAAAGQPAVTKAEVLTYYTAIAPVLLPHLIGRPLTLRRWPDGVTGPSFFAKNAPPGRPEWIRTVRLPSPGSGKNRDEIDYLLIDGLAGLVWVANLAALELHTPLWQVRDGHPEPSDLLVLDLDPGPPATVVDCAALAQQIRDRLPDKLADSLRAKTSGQKGLQLYAPWSAGDSREFARDIAERLARELPDRVVSRMTRALRPGKVLIDWSQNNTAKTTVAAYSLRAGPRPTVSAPVRWEELERASSPQDLVFTPAQVLERVGRDGDLFAPLLPQP